MDALCGAIYEFRLPPQLFNRRPTASKPPPECSPLGLVRLQPDPAKQPVGIVAYRNLAFLGMNASILQFTRTVPARISAPRLFSNASVPEVGTFLYPQIEIHRHRTRPALNSPE